MTDAELPSLDADALCLEFVAGANSAEAQFKRLGKVLFWLQVRLAEEELPAGGKRRRAFRVLQDRGVSRAAVSNASYAAKVFGRVQAGEISEAEYDAFTFQQCQDISRDRAPRVAPGKGHRAEAEEHSSAGPLDDLFELLSLGIDENPRGDVHRLQRLLTAAHDALLAGKDCITATLPQEWGDHIARALTPIGRLRYEIAEFLGTAPPRP